MTDKVKSQDTASKELPSPQVLNEGEFLEGTIEWFKKEKRYGFIKIDYRCQTVFLHISDVPPELHATLTAGDRVRFKMVMYEGKTKASEISLIEDKEVQAAA